jgi:hypothetical protein
LIAEWGKSGERVVEFAARHGVRPKSVWHWRSVLAPTVRRHRQPSLAKIVEVRPAHLLADDRFEVRLAGARSIGVPPSFDGAALERLLHVLEKTS